MGQKHILKSSPAQRDSKMTKSGVCCSTRPSRTVDLRTCPRRARTTISKAILKNSPAQQDSKMTNRGMRIIGVIGVIGVMGRKPAMKKHRVEPHSKNSNGRLSGGFCWPQGQDKNSPAQGHSKFSKLRNRPLSPLCLFSPLAPKNSSAQQDSKFSKLVLGWLKQGWLERTFRGKLIGFPGSRRCFVTGT